MMRFKHLSFLLLAALPVSSSGAAVDNFDSLRVLSLETHTATRDVKANDETNRVDEKHFIETNADCLSLLTTSEPTPRVLTLAKHNRFRDVQGPKLLEPAYDLNPLYNDLISSRGSAEMSFSVSAIISNARESAQHAIDAIKASASSVVESVMFTVGSNPSTTVRSTSSTLESTSYASESTSLIIDDSTRVSHDLNISSGQLAGIVIGVFLVSSFFSILATFYILRYRRQRAVITHNTLGSPGETKRRMLWPSFSNLCGNPISPKYPVNITTEHRQFPNTYLSGMTPQNHQKSPINQIPFVSPISPSKTHNQTHPMSPLSDKQHDNPSQDRSPSLELGLFRNDIQSGSGSGTTDLPPIKFTLSRKATQYGTHQIQVIRVGNQETTPRRLLSNVRTPNTFLLHDRTPDSTVSHEVANMRHSTNRMDKSTMTLTPIINLSARSPPTIPLRFSSLNASNTSQHQSFRGNGGTFLLSTDDESTEHVPGPQSSHSSIISRDLTQFDPGGLSQQPTSRFSMSSAPVSLDYSASSTSPVQQQEHPEISPLRPAPPSPLQLQAPVPRRPNLPLIHAPSNVSLAKTTSTNVPTPLPDTISPPVCQILPRSSVLACTG
ncbi:hypothetical protein F5Y12DRAFT_782351 [Xylaria sp. FL1777]|nr:hypothetical protein F5Y12DRAFT_782351 [Xylaria sp. FL1777]